MKKTYAKPVIMFESFALSTNISAGCEVTSLQSSGKCGLEVRGGRVVFIDSSTGCNVQVPYDVSHQDFVYNNDNNEVCYHVPIESFNLFNS